LELVTALEFLSVSRFYDGAALLARSTAPPKRSLEDDVEGWDDGSWVAVGTFSSRSTTIDRAGRVVIAKALREQVEPLPGREIEN
jgi:hypothetical protein